MKFKQNSIVSSNFEDVLPKYPGSVTQVADNVDHSICTLDGKNTFHGMGVIAVSTPFEQPQHNSQNSQIQRNKIMKVGIATVNKGIPIKWFSKNRQNQVYPLKSLNRLSSYSSHTRFLFLLAVTCFVILPKKVYTGNKPRSSWAGFIQDVSVGTNLPPANMTMLPIIDLKSSDESYIYSMLSYVKHQATLLNIPTACITFDQPLWWKAVEIIDAKSMDIVYRLGGFHTMMSFLGSLGSLMNGAGLSELLTAVYGGSSVTHILSGKAISRALRAHLLVHTALMSKLIEAVLPDQQTSNLTEDAEPEEDDSFRVEQNSSTENEADNLDNGGHQTSNSKLHDNFCEMVGKFLNEKLKQSDVLYEKRRAREISSNEISNYPALVKMRRALDTLMHELRGRSRTTKLWLAFIEYIDALKLFIRAERTRDWNLHLVAVRKMPNLFAATGHFNYVNGC